MRLGQQDRKPCPYFFCSAIVVVYATKRHFEDPDDQMVQIIPTHEIRNDNLPPETCPASLMSFPLDQEMLTLLHGMERRHYNTLLEKARRENSELPRMPFLEPPPSGSQSMLPKPGSRRFGRTPATEEDQPDWALGGRDDEDVQADPKTHPVPPTTGGYPMTGRSGMSNADVQAQIAAANAEANGAIGAMTEAKDPSILAAISHVEDALDMTGNAYSGLENARAGIAAANAQVSESLVGVVAEYERTMEELQLNRAALQLVKENLQAALAVLETRIAETAALVEIAGQFSDSLNR